MDHFPRIRNKVLALRLNQISHRMHFWGRIVYRLRWRFLHPAAPVSAIEGTWRAQLAANRDARRRGF